MPLTLTPEQERRVTAYARQKQQPVERVLDEILADLPQPTETPETTPSLSISEALLQMADAMPEAERAQMPPDLAAQHDHYLYGWDKK